MSNRKYPDFSFIEYTYDPHTVSREIMAESLVRAGFALRTVHNRTPITLWVQNQCIIFLRELEGVDYPQISGLGFIAPVGMIESLGASYDVELGMYRTGDTNGTRILFFSNQDIDADVFSADYSVVDTVPHDNVTGMKYFSGLILSGFTARQMDFYQELGFKFVKSTDGYNSLLSNNNRFSIHLNKRKMTNCKKTLIAETHDIFNTTAKLYLNELKPDVLDLTYDDIDKFESLAHRIVGYNCYAHGNYKSYSIENIVSDFIPNTDLLFRCRKKQLEISEKSLDYFYGERYNIKEE